MCQMQCILASLRNKAAGKRNGDAYLNRVSTQDKEKEKKQDIQESNIFWTF